MNRRDKAERIGRILDELCPRLLIPLQHVDPFSLLVAVMLSAQTTDKMVHRIMPNLMSQAADAKTMAVLPLATLLRTIRPIGLAPTKARNLKATANLLLERHAGQVPVDMQALEQLPGVGHKTASVVLAQGFGIPTFPVDTHIHRLAGRWGLSRAQNVRQTETDLKQLFPRETWIRRHLQIIEFGRKHCPARRHDFKTYPICS
jgi:endonuclease-3